MDIITTRDTPQNLTRRMRAAIREQRLPEWVRAYVAGMFPKRDVPQWVVDALDVSGISLEGIADKAPAHDFERELKDGCYAVPLPAPAAAAAKGNTDTEEGR